MTESLSDKVVRNALYNAAGFLWSAAVLLFQVSYVLSVVGPELYGVWSLALVISSYFSLLDFGFATTFVKFIAEYRTKEDADGINRVLTNGLLFYLAIDCVIVLLSFFFLGDLLNFLNVPPHVMESASVVATLAIVIFLFSNTFLNPLIGILHGSQRMDLTNWTTILVSVPRVAGLVIVLESGFGLVGVMLNELAGVLLTIGILAWQARRIIPSARVGRKYLNWQTFARLFRFGSLLQVSVLSGLVNFHYDKLLLSKFLGLTLLTYYDLGARVVSKIRGFPLIVASSLLPTFSSLSRADNRQEIRELYIQGSKAILVFILPIFGLILLLAEPIVSLWLGEGYELTILTMQFLAVAYCINVFTAVAANAAQGMGYPQIESKTGVIQTVANVILSTVLFFIMGFRGVLYGTTIALAFGALYHIWSVNSLLEVSLKKFTYSVVLTPLGCLLGVLLAVKVMLVFLANNFPMNSLDAEIVSTLLAAGGLVSVYFALLYRGNYISRDEREKIKGSLKRFLIKADGK